jgi:hypothetical protein
MELRGLDSTGTSKGPLLKHWTNQVSCEIRSEATEWSSLFDSRGPRRPEGYIDSIQGMVTRSAAAAQDNAMSRFEEIHFKMKLKTANKTKMQEKKASTSPMSLWTRSSMKKSPS